MVFLIVIYGLIMSCKKQNDLFTAVTNFGDILVFISLASQLGK